MKPRTGVINTAGDLPVLDSIDLFLTNLGLDPEADLFQMLSGILDGWTVAFFFGLTSIVIGHIMIGGGTIGGGLSGMRKVLVSAGAIIGLLLLMSPHDDDARASRSRGGSGKFVSVSADRKPGLPQVRRSGGGGITLATGGNRADGGYLSGLVSDATGGSVDTDRLIEETTQKMQAVLP